jgi:hypothetical protein
MKKLILAAQPHGEVDYEEERGEETMNTIQYKEEQSSHTSTT